MSVAVMVDYSASARRRAARKTHRCGPCGRGIRVGDVYLELTEFPGHDAGYASHAGHPVRTAECARCAIRYGREHLMDEIPWEQLCRDGLL